MKVAKILESVADAFVNSSVATLGRWIMIMLSVMPFIYYFALKRLHSALLAR